MEKHYIGLVGQRDMREAKETASVVNDVLAKRGLPKSHIIQLGVLVTTRTLRGETTENRRNPRVGDIGHMFDAALSINRDLFTVVHYSTRDTSSLVPAVQAILALTRMATPNLSNCRGIQLNGQFGKVTPYQVEQMKKMQDKLKIILQLHKQALDSFSIQKICDDLAFFEGLADYVLIDPSGGRGEELVVEKYADLGREIFDRTRINIGFAGSFQSENVERIIGQLREKFGPEFSFDAERGLRDIRGESYGNDDYNIAKVRDFLCKSVRGVSV